MTINIRENKIQLFNLGLKDVRVACRAGRLLKAIKLLLTLEENENGQVEITSSEFEKNYKLILKNAETARPAMQERVGREAYRRLSGKIGKERIARAAQAIGLSKERMERLREAKEWFDKAANRPLGSFREVLAADKLRIEKKMKETQSRGMGGHIFRKMSDGFLAVR